jgi:hypothetical protein
VHREYGLDEQATLFALANPDNMPEGMLYQDSLATLADWVMHSGQA